MPSRKTKLLPFKLFFHIMSTYWLRACLKIHSCNLHAPLCGKFVPKSVSVARTPPAFGTNFPQTVTHISQKAIFKHALVITKTKERIKHEGINEI